MWEADSKPSQNAAIETALACVSSTRSRNQVLNTFVKAALHDIAANSVRYRQRGKSGELHDANPQDFSLPELLNHDKMRWLYKNRLKKQSVQAAYAIYEALRGSGPNGYCAYCRYQNPGTLDHFLPKAEFGTLAIEPWNLVPCCADCNNARDDRSRDSRLIHPYFWGADLGRWLFATIDTRRPVTMRFFAKPSPDLDNEIRNRIIRQFNSLKTARLYSRVAADTIAAATSDLRHGRGIFQLEHAKGHLSDEASRAFRVDPNILRGVIYDTLAGDDAYILDCIAV